MGWWWVLGRDNGGAEFTAAVTEYRVPVARARFREIDQQHVQQALRFRATVFGAGQHEATAPNLVGVFGGDMGHCIDQVRVAHGFSIS